MTATITRVFRAGLRAPTFCEDVVRQQLRAAHDYRNDLIAIERGRRAALRAVDAASEAVTEAAELVRAATRSTRRAAIQALGAARRAARAEAADELARIQALDDSIRRDARALTTCYWGTYLDIEARHQQSRSANLYGEDAMTPNDPAFQRGPRWQHAVGPDDPRRHWWLTPGQLGVQLQGGLSTPDALSGTDTRVRLDLSGSPGGRGRKYGVLHVRVGSDGRAPVWASWPIKLHRPLPVDAIWKWVRISVRAEGLCERWSVEITMDIPARPRAGLPTSGTAAIEWEWSAGDDGSIRVARWCDDRGEGGEIRLPGPIANGIRKPAGHRAVRDIILNDLRERLQREILADASAPTFARAEAPTMHLWQSQQRFRALAMRWRLAGGGGVGKAFQMLDEWERRDRHLYDYEACARGEALRERREFYRLLAAEWRRRYARVLVSDQDLSREARWGDDSDVRFIAGISELRLALRNAFGDDAVDARWRDGADENEERSWCERTRDAWAAGGARGDGRFAALKQKTTNAWAARRAKKRPVAPVDGAARNPDHDAAE